MTQLRPGQKMKSAVCTAEVMIIKAPGSGRLTCGGVDMLGPKEESAGAAADPASLTGCEIGKRYVNADQTLEVLCVKAGSGGLACDGTALSLKDAKKLPSSD